MGKIGRFWQRRFDFFYIPRNGLASIPPTAQFTGHHLAGCKSNQSKFISRTEKVLFSGPCREKRSILVSRGSMRMPVVLDYVPDCHPCIAGSMRMPIMPSVDALLNGIAIGRQGSAFLWASLLAMLTDIAPFFDEMFTDWQVPFLTSEPGTLGVRSSISAPSPGFSRIRSSAIHVRLESTRRVGFPFGWNWDWRYSLENGWNAPLKAGIWFLRDAEIQRQLCQKLRFR
jgi:hypothetical protein